MKSFAERLVARGAGQPVGLPLLTPRPAARFEREIVASPDAETPVGSQEEATPAAAPAPRKSNPALVEADIAAKPASDHSVRRRNVTATESAMPSSRPTDAAPSAPVATPLAPGPDSRGVASVAMPEPFARQETLVEEAEFLPRHPRLHFDEPRTSRVTQNAHQIERELAAPAISIGRIEVQFLPQEKPVAPPRPEPQRTRGFEAYTRARRGLPR